MASTFFTANKVCGVLSDTPCVIHGIQKLLLELYAYEKKGFG